MTIERLEKVKEFLKIVLLISIIVNSIYIIIIFKKVLLF